ncbi:MAG: endonuclease III, partial [Candidatus Pacebacteria bacterium]|nr:endonuclease III [Candidatus Paceibacterota bacterium]
SAQCTDDRVNQVTRVLFAKYPESEEYLSVDRKELEQLIFSTGFYRAKARHILGAAHMLHHEFGGVLPDRISEMIRLPGVGRKTANVVIQNIFNSNQGIAVDTHVLRFAKRFHLSSGTTAHVVEKDLMAIIPKRAWRDAGYYMKQYGRTYGPARGWNQETDPLWQYYQKIGGLGPSNGPSSRIPDIARL